MAHWNHLAVVGILLFSFNSLWANSLPHKNPYPPKKQDSQRIDFAKKSLQEIYNNPDLISNYTWFRIYDDSYKNKSATCIKNPDCVLQDLRFQRDLHQLRARHGQIIDIKFPHIDPWSQKRLKHKYRPEKKIKTAPWLNFTGPQALADEFMVHFFVRFSKNSQTWHHFNVLLHEGDAGTLQLRQFHTHLIAKNKNLPGLNCRYKDKKHKKSPPNPLKELDLEKMSSYEQEFASNPPFQLERHY